MGIFRNFKRKGKKEYMKYEDGKIIPVKVEEHRNYEEFTISPVQREDENIKTVIKEKIDMPGKVKKYGTFKTLKIVGAIAVIIFFGYTVKDVYVTFTEDNTAINGNQSDKPNTPGQDGSGDTNSIVPPLEDDKKEDNDKDKDKVKPESKSNLQQAFDTSIVVNNMVYSELDKEVNYFTLYSKNRLNLVSFETKINESLNTKNQLISYLLERKKLFQAEDIEDFYDATERRLKHSILLSETLLDSLKTDMSDDEVKRRINLIMDKDNEYKEKQTEAFIDVLKTKDIDYTFDEINEEIKYSLK